MKDRKDIDQPITETGRSGYSGVYDGPKANFKNEEEPLYSDVLELVERASLIVRLGIGEYTPIGNGDGVEKMGICSKAIKTWTSTHDVLIRTRWFGHSYWAAP